MIILLNNQEEKNMTTTFVIWQVQRAQLHFFFLEKMLSAIDDILTEN